MMSPSATGLPSNATVPETGTLRGPDPQAGSSNNKAKRRELGMKDLHENHRGTRAARWRPGAKVSQVARNLATLAGAGGLPGHQADAVGHQPNRTVGKEDVDAAGVIAASGLD